MKSLFHIFENCGVYVRDGFFTNSDVCVKTWDFLEKSHVCVKVEDYISHLPLSLTVGVHPPWVFAGKQYSAVIYAKNNSGLANDPFCHKLNPLNNKQMNKAEFKAISIIADKLNWQNKPVMEVCETIKQMVRNQQALELDTVGECDGDEETLLSIALWNHDKIVSTMYVSDYESLVMWGVQCFCDDMGITPEDFSALLTWNSIKDNFLAPEYELEDIAYEEAMCDGYDAEMMREVMWMNHHC